MIWRCRICGIDLKSADAFSRHLKRCVERHADVIDQLRPREPFEGDPELLAFAQAEGDVYNRRPGTRKQPR